MASVKEQKDFEKSLFTKTHKGAGDVILLDNWTIVYRNNVDLLLYVVGSTNENEVRRIWSERKSLRLIDLVNVKYGFNMFIRSVEFDVEKKCGEENSL